MNATHRQHIDERHLAQEPSGPAEEWPEVRASRATLWLIWGGFGMMFVAALLMWAQFGPNIFFDLATAVVNCF